MCLKCDEFSQCLPIPGCEPTPECLVDEDCPKEQFCDGGVCQPTPPPPSLPLCDSSSVELSQWTLTRTPHSLGLVDLEGDGDLDLFAALSPGAKIEFALNDGAGVLSSGGELNLAPVLGVGEVAAGDLDGDGDIDLVAELPDSDELVLILGQNGTLIPGPTLPCSLALERLDVLDLESDGDVDLVLNSGTDLVVRLGDGVSTPSSAVRRAVFFSASGVAEAPRAQEVHEPHLETRHRQRSCVLELDLAGDERERSPTRRHHRPPRTER